MLVPARRARRWRPVHTGIGQASDLVRSLTKDLGAAARGSVRSVTLRSNLSPDVMLTGSDLVPGGPVRPFRFREALLRLAKPEIELDTVAGRIRIAPYGEPTTNLFWPVLILGSAGITALAILALKGWQKG